MSPESCACKVWILTYTQKICMFVVPMPYICCNQRLTDTCKSHGAIAAALLDGHNLLRTGITGRCQLNMLLTDPSKLCKKASRSMARCKNRPAEQPSNFKSIRRLKQGFRKYLHTSPPDSQNIAST